MRRWKHGNPVVYDLTPMSKVEIVVAGEDVRDSVEAIADVVRRSHHGEATITVSPVDDAVRVRTGEHGLRAIQDFGAPAIEPRRTIDQPQPAVVGFARSILGLA